MDWVGVAGTLFGCMVSVALTVATSKYKRPVYVHTFVNLISSPKELGENISINYKEKKVDILSKSTIVIWNEGRKSIRGVDLLKDNPFGIKINSGEIIEYSYLSTTGMSKTLKIYNNNNFLKLEFDAMQKHEGFVLEILHTSRSEEDVVVTGGIDDCIKIKSGRMNQAEKCMIVLIAIFFISFVLYAFTSMGLTDGKLFGLGFFQGNGTFLNRYASEMGLIGMMFLQLMMLFISYKLMKTFTHVYPNNIEKLLENKKGGIKIET